MEIVIKPPKNRRKEFLECPDCNMKFLAVESFDAHMKGVHKRYG